MKVPVQYDDVAFMEEVHHLLREARRWCRRRAWRRNVVLRSTRLSVTLRAVEKALAPAFSRRMKDPATRTWSFFAKTPTGERLVAVVGGGPTKTLDDLRSPIRVDIVAADFFDLDLLCRLTHAPHPAVKAASI